MSAQAEPSPSRLLEPQVPEAVPLYRQGVLAGLFGAILLAVWFFYLDLSRGRPLHTPTLLGTILFRRGAGLGSPEALPASIPLTLLFTLVHGLVFALIGVVAARLLGAVERRRLALAFLLVFAVLTCGFFGFVLNFSAVGPGALAVRDVLVGNAIAASAIVVYLSRHQPGSKA